MLPTAHSASDKANPRLALGTDTLSYIPTRAEDNLGLLMNRSLSGDPTRQAVESLRGYAYQLYASAIVWMTLPQHGRLYLEVAEDYATLVANTLNAVQVKATSRPVTLNTTSVIETINSLFDLKERNPGNVVTIDYLTTSVIGREAAAKHLVEGVGGLEYWLQAAAGAEIEPLRKRLLELPLSLAAAKFLKCSTDAELRDDLIARINWRCGEPPLDDLRERLQEFAVYRCEQKGEPIRFADPFADKILVRVLETAVQKPAKPLTAAQLITLFDGVTQTSVRTSVLEQLLSPRADVNDGDSGSIVLTQPALEELAVSPFTLAPRSALVDSVCDVLKSVGLAWLHAGSGYGKTTLAAMSADRHGGVWKVARCGGLDARATAAKLRRVAIEVNNSNCAGVVIDDVDQVADRDVLTSFGLLVRALKSRSCVAVATSHEVPQSMRIREWALEPDIVIAVNDFSEEEVTAIVEAEGGDPLQFGRYVYMGSAAGHPQLTHALVLGLKSRGWPESDVENLLAIVGGDSDLQAVRAEVRRRLLRELPASDLQLLGRLTLVVGSFPRSLAMALAEKPPEIEVPGAAFDRLLGPWIDTVAKDKFRPSSLVSGLGMELLGPEAIVRLNGVIARLRIPGKAINPEDADGIFLNAVIGNAIDILEAIFTATFGSPVSDFPRLAQALGMVCALRTDQPLISDHPKISAQIRALQVLLIAASEKKAKLFNVIAAFDRELAELKDGYASTLNFGVIGKLSMLPEVIDFLPGYVTRVASLRHDPAVRRQINESFPSAEGMPSEPDDVVRSLFASQIMTTKRMTTLRRFLAEVADLPKDDRDFFVRPFAFSPGDKALAVRGPWRAAPRAGDASKSLVLEYLALAEKAVELGDQEVGLAAYETAAVICDEDLSDPERGLDILEIGKRYAQDVWSLDRHRCRIFFNMKRYERQLDVAEQLIQTSDAQDLEMVYLLRETAISYAHTGQHGASADCFLKAAGMAASSKLPDVLLMALGLRADEAVEAFEDGQKPRALKALVEVLSEVERLKGEGLREIALKTLVPHTIAAISGRCDEGDPPPRMRLHLFPGLNSNPNPSPEIADQNRGPSDLIWIVLYHLERLFECNCGVERLLRSAKWDDLIPTSTDLYLIHDRFKQAFVEGNAAEFCASVVAQAAAEKWARNSNLFVSIQLAPRGRVPRLRTSELETHRTFIGGAALLYIVYHTLKGSYEIVEEFIEHQKTEAFPPLTAEELASFEGGLNSKDNYETAAVGTLYRAIRDGGRVSAEDAFIIGVRLIGMRSHAPTGEAFDKLFDWLMAEWEHIVREQRFRLRMPDAAAAVIDRQREEGDKGIVGLAQFYCAIVPHVAVGLSPDMMQDLLIASKG